jgi:coenzyme F420-0:L-glutamate ligase/coenzyme F420-1:gamma-L-glutamate ligase
MFSLGTAEARADGLRSAATLPDDGAAPGHAGPAARAGADPGPASRALALVGPLLAPGTGVDVAGRTIRCTPPARDAAALVRFGADLHRLRAALAAEGVASTVAVDAGTGLPSVLELSAVELSK